MTGKVTYFDTRKSDYYNME